MCQSREARPGSDRWGRVEWEREGGGSSDGKIKFFRVDHIIHRGLGKKALQGTTITDLT